MRTRRARLWTGSGFAALALVTLLLPALGDGGQSLTLLVLAYVLTFVPVGMILHGLPSLWENMPTRAILITGAAAAALCVPAAFLSRPEALTGGAGVPLLLTLLLANALRLLAAAALALALARHVTSPGVALLIAGVATASDLFSVFAGPTRALVREDSPALDFLLLVFPAFGQPAGFALGVSDFIFLTLFAAIARLLELRYPLTLAAGVTAILLALACGLFLGRPLPALPFIALSFVLVNAKPLVAALRKPRPTPR